jgi:hypothetical protein
VLRIGRLEFYCAEANPLNRLGCSPRIGVAEATPKINLIFSRSRPHRRHTVAQTLRGLRSGWTMIWLVSLAYGAAVLVVVTALVFAIIWSVEKLAVKNGRREHARAYRLIRWLGRDIAD